MTDNWSCLHVNSRIKKVLHAFLFSLSHVLNFLLTVVAPAIFGRPLPLSWMFWADSNVNLSGSLVERLDQWSDQRPEHWSQPQFPGPDFRFLPEPAQQTLPHRPHPHPWSLLVWQSTGGFLIRLILSRYSDLKKKIPLLGCRWHQRPTQWWSG